MEGTFRQIIIHINSLLHITGGIINHNR